jgi:FtsZ-interacting cell division protein ZipA
METWEWIVLVGIVALALVLLAAFVRIRRRRSHLKERFGTEYYRAVSSEGTGGAERHLSEVEQEHERLELKSLPTPARDRFLDEWRQAESRFVSDPREATRAAERLVERVLEERGYPVDDGDAEHRTALVSVDHPDVVDR